MPARKGKKKLSSTAKKKKKGPKNDYVNSYGNQMLI